MKCKKCDNKSVKNGKRNGLQRYYCNDCKHSFQLEYLKMSYAVKDKEIKTLVKEGCGIRSISRILKMSPNTVINRIKRIAREIIDFAVGTRSLKSMRPVTETVVLSEPKQIFTDKYVNYKTLIPQEIHTTKHRCINYIERMNLTLRTHLKRLNRRTICYTKSITMLIACLKIYFWG